VRWPPACEDVIQGAQDRPLLEDVTHTGPGTHPSSCPVSTCGSPPGVKGSGSEADHSSLSSAEVKNSGAILPSPPIRLHSLVLNYLNTGTILPTFY
jgi:hypothetical protein